MKIFLILIIGLVLRLITLNQSFWLDEAAQVIESSRPFFQQFDLTADFHPPLYHLFLHFWLKMGRSEIWVRLLSVILGFSCLWYVYKLAKLKFKEGPSLAAALLLAVSAYHVYYSQETRPYILFSLLSLVSTYYLLKKKYAVFTAVLIASWYSSYFTPLLLFGQGLAVFFQEKKELRLFIRSALISLFFFLPWLPELKKQLAVGFSGSFEGWQEIVSFGLLRNLGLTFARFSLGRESLDNYYLYFLLIVPLLAASFWSGWVAIKKRRNLEFSLLFWGPFLLSLVLSYFLPVVAPQRLLFLLPFLYLSIVSELNLKPLFYAILLVSLASLGAYYYFPRFQRENWREAVAFIENDKGGNKLAVFAFPEPFAPFAWYSQNVPGLGAAGNFRVTDEDIVSLKMNLFWKNKIYYFDYLAELTDPGKRLLGTLRKSNFRERDIKNFEGVGFIRIYEN